MAEDISRKNLDNQEFFKLRQVTEKIANFLNKRLTWHLDILKPLLTPRKLLGAYVKSAVMEDVPGSDKAFAELQERYAAVCEKPFTLPRKLQSPLPPISTQLDATPFQYPLYFAGSGNKPVSITSPTRWILAYQSDCPLNRLKAMVSGMEPRQPDDMRQAVINHLLPVVYMKQLPDLKPLFEDLRYQVETKELGDLGGLPVVVVNAPLETFLPPDDFIFQITQLSGIAAFQEIIDSEAIEKIPDNLKGALRNLLR
jgi:hypothetical protein